MASNLEELRETIHNIGDLDTVVRTMRALAMVNSRQYEAAREAMAAYGETILLGLQAAMGQRHNGDRPMAMAARPGDTDPWDEGAPSRSGRRGLILFGSDHGLCGPFNEQILELASKLLEAESGPGGGVNGGWRLAVVGTKLTGLLEAAGLAAATSLRQPHDLAGVEGLMADLLMAIDAWRQDGGLGEVWLLHHRCRSATTLEPVRSRLLPIDAAWLEELARRPWESRSLPQVQGDRRIVLEALLREHLGHRLSEASVASLAAENTARLLAMQGARGHIEDRLAELTALYRQQRQSAITEELLDVVAGFEALNSGVDGSHPGPGSR